MKSHFLILSFCFLFFSPTKSSAQTESSETYTYKFGDPNGIGKWYMGREIAYVMGYQGIEWLERPEREQEEKVSKLIENLELLPSDTIADIGAGSGYHTFKMAPYLSQGRVYAVDIQEEMLDVIAYRSDNSDQTNVSIIKSSETSLYMGERTINKALLVDVYHEFSHPKEIMISLYKAMKPGGKVYLVEYRGEDLTIPIKAIHKMTESQAILEMRAVGFRFKQNIDNLPWQHFLVFEK
jgi:ubiquinone/menaquinone biosynthesis C-methylase UbiE